MEEITDGRIVRPPEPDKPEGERARRKISKAELMRMHFVRIRSATDDETFVKLVASALKVAERDSTLKKKSVRAEADEDDERPDVGALLRKFESKKEK
jgi:hypothetical protein